MIVVEAGHANVIQFLLLSCELPIFVAVTVIFSVKSAAMSILYLFFFFLIND
jgi:ATP/ADP translocase